MVRTVWPERDGGLGLVEWGFGFFHFAIEPYLQSMLVLDELGLLLVHLSRCSPIFLVALVCVWICLLVSLSWCI